jgi:DNA modification methylase
MYKQTMHDQYIMSEGKKQILLGDCLELMKQLPDGSIDLILCDLP